jgi:hypothetical protein
MDLNTKTFIDRDAECRRQFRILSDLGLDAIALIAVSQPNLTEIARELCLEAHKLSNKYIFVPNALRGSILARMLVALTLLFEFVHNISNHNDIDNEDPALHMTELTPVICNCIKFVSDEIVAYARAVAGEKSETTAVVDQGSKNNEAESRAVEERRRAADVLETTHGQATADRDTAYAVVRAPPYQVNNRQVNRQESDLCVDRAPYIEDNPYAEDTNPEVVLEHADSSDSSDDYYKIGGGCIHWSGARATPIGTQTTATIEKK